MTAKLRVAAILRVFIAATRSLAVMRFIWAGLLSFKIGIFIETCLSADRQVSIKMELKTKNLHFRANLLHTLYDTFLPKSEIRNCILGGAETILPQIFISFRQVTVIGNRGALQDATVIVMQQFGQHFFNKLLAKKLRRVAW
jgi:hypothetical protein